MDVFLTFYPLKEILQIIGIDILLAADNMIMIALVCKDLQPNDRLRGMILGILFALVLRMVMFSLSLGAFDFLFVRLVSGLVLYYFAIKLSYNKDYFFQKKHLVSPNGVGSVIKKIVIADLLMSFDNVLAISAITKNLHSQHSIGLIFLSLLISISIMFFGGEIVSNLFLKFPILAAVGSAFLGWIAIELLSSDPIWIYLNIESNIFSYWLTKMVASILVFVVSFFLQKKGRNFL